MRAKASQTRRRLAAALIVSVLLAGAAPATQLVSGPATPVAMLGGGGTGP